MKKKSLLKSLINQNPLINFTNFCAYSSISAFPYQLGWGDLIEKEDLACILASRRSGKMLREDEVILTNRGWVKLKDLTLNDKVYGSDGKLAKIDFITDLQEDLNMYRITLRDGREIECCEDHLWKVFDRNNQSKWIDGTNKSVGQKNYKWSVKSTKDMAKKFYYSNTRSYGNNPPKEYKNYLYALPLNESIDYPEKELLIHPYVLGCLIGDGSFRANDAIGFTCCDKEILDKVESLLPKGYTLSTLKGKYEYNIIRKDKSLPGFKKLLKELGLNNLKSKDKFIPRDYLAGSTEQRMELLRGLMDTDGTAGTSTEYYTVSVKLKDDVMYLNRSLGIYTSLYVKQSHLKGVRYKDCYCIRLNTTKQIFSLSRKNNIHQRKKGAKTISRNNKVFITNIQPIGKGRGYCIGVKNNDHTYITRDFIVTHNSYGLSAIATYLGLKYPGININIFAPTLQQAKRDLEYIDALTSLRKLSGQVKKTLRTSLVFKNSSKIECFGQKSNIDSANTDVALIDERADMSDRIVNERILPTLAAKNPYFNSKIIVTGTCKYQGDALDRIVTKGEGNYNIGDIVDWEKGVRYGAINGSTVQTIRDQITEEEFQRAFCCKWVEDDSQVLPEKVLKRASSSDPYTTEAIHEKDIEYSFCGVDIGGRGVSGVSETSVVVLSKLKDKKSLYLSHFSTYDRFWRDIEIIEVLQQIYREYKCNFMTLDIYGQNLCFQLQQKIFKRSEDKSLPIQPVRMNAKSKHDLFQDTKTALDGLEILLPIETKGTEKLFTQLRNQYLTRATNWNRYLKKKATVGDDLLDALAFALKAFRLYTTGEQKKPEPKITTFGGARFNNNAFRRR